MQLLFRVVGHSFISTPLFMAVKVTFSPLKNGAKVSNVSRKYWPWNYDPKNCTHTALTIERIQEGKRRQNKLQWNILEPVTYRYKLGGVRTWHFKNQNRDEQKYIKEWLFNKNGGEMRATKKFKVIHFETRYRVSCFYKAWHPKTLRNLWVCIHLEEWWLMMMMMKAYSAQDDIGDIQYNIL